MKLISGIVLTLCLFSTAMAGSDVTLAWDANTEADLAGYNVFYGTETRNYSSSVDAGNVTEYTVKNLSDGTWYFAVTAYDDSGNESGYSNEPSNILDDQTPPGNPKTVIIKVIVQVEVVP